MGDVVLHLRLVIQAPNPVKRVRPRIKPDTETVDSAESTVEDGKVDAVEDVAEGEPKVENDPPEGVGLKPKVKRDVSRLDQYRTQFALDHMVPKAKAKSLPFKG